MLLVSGVCAEECHAGTARDLGSRGVSRLLGRSAISRATVEVEEVERGGIEGYSFNRWPGFQTE